MCFEIFSLCKVQYSFLAICFLTQVSNNQWIIISFFFVSLILLFLFFFYNELVILSIHIRIAFICGISGLESQQMQSLFNFKNKNKYKVLIFLFSLFLWLTYSPPRIHNQFSFLCMNNSNHNNNRSSVCLLLPYFVIFSLFVMTSDWFVTSFANTFDWLLAKIEKENLKMW